MVKILIIKNALTFHWIEYSFPLYRFHYAMGKSGTIPVGDSLAAKPFVILFDAQELCAIDTQSS